MVALKTADRTLLGLVPGVVLTWLLVGSGGSELALEYVRPLVTVGFGPWVIRLIGLVQFGLVLAIWIPYVRAPAAVFATLVAVGHLLASIAAHAQGLAVAYAVMALAGIAVAAMHADDVREVYRIPRHYPVDGTRRA